MKVRLAGFLLVTLCLWILHGYAAPPKEELWRTDLDAAVGEARETGKPMLVVFRCDP